MRPKQDAEGKLTIFMDPQWPVTYRSGKVDVIKRELPAAPLLVAGDSNTDFEMLTHFDETVLRLIINRNKSGDIKTLYDQDLQQNLLQGRDENHCRFRPARETVQLGKTQPTSLR